MDFELSEKAGFQPEDIRVYRHWCPSSEEYAGGDALLTLLDKGWQITGVIFCQEFWCGQARRHHVYHFQLVRDQMKHKLSVISNPYVARMVRESGVQTVLFNQRKKTDGLRW
jgi:hypothetical protein